MVFEQIEALKKQFTDKYVMVDDSQPELRRFKGQTGLVRTVNMNGKALVEFDAYLNIGWYDIQPNFLTIIDKPLEKPEKPAAQAPVKTAAKKPAAKPAAQAPPSDAAMSTADVLAAARGGGAAAAPKAKEPAQESAAKVDPGKMSTADVLAAARGGAAKKPAEEVPAPAAKPEPAASQPVAESAQPAAPAELPTDMDEILAFCRERDGK